MKNYIIIQFIVCMLPVIGIFLSWTFGSGGAGRGIGLIFLGLLASFIISILTGIIGVKYTQSIWIPAIINCAVILIGVLLAGELEVGVLILPVFILTFLSSFFTKLFTSPFSNSLVQKGGIFLLILLIVAFVFTFFSYLFDKNEDNKNFFLDTKSGEMGYRMESVGHIQLEKYNKYAEATGINENISNRSKLYKDKNGIPYSGRFYLHKPKLRINPFPKRRKNLYYYIDGYLWGFSHSGSYSGYYTDNALLYLPGMPASVPFLISNTYEKHVLESLSIAGEYYRVSDDTILALGEDNNVYMGKIGYHTNTLVGYISWDRIDFTNTDTYGWENFHTRYFDSLGYYDDDDNRTRWKPDAFSLTDTIPNLLSPMGTIKDPEKIKLIEEAFINPVRIWLPDTDYTWNYEETLLYNISKMHGFGENNISIMIADNTDDYYHAMEIPDMQIVGNAIEQCTIETYYERGTERGDIYFLILENGSDKKFTLTYKKGRFYMENNFYRFIFPEDKQEELANLMLTCIRKYKEYPEK